MFAFLKLPKQFFKGEQLKNKKIDNLSYEKKQSKEDLSEIKLDEIPDFST